jgi:hypothetical protein
MECWINGILGLEDWWDGKEWCSFPDDYLEFVQIQINIKNINPALHPDATRFDALRGRNMLRPYTFSLLITHYSLLSFRPGPAAVVIDEISFHQFGIVDDIVELLQVFEAAFFQVFGNQREVAVQVEYFLFMLMENGKSDIENSKIFVVAAEQPFPDGTNGETLIRPCITGIDDPAEVEIERHGEISFLLARDNPPDVVTRTDRPIGIAYHVLEYPNQCCGDNVCLRQQDAGDFGGFSVVPFGQVFVTLDKESTFGKPFLLCPGIDIGNIGHAHPETPGGQDIE